MVSSTRLTVSCLILIFTASICAQTQTVTEKVATSTISGRVTLKGNGVSGIVVGLVLIDNYRNQSVRNNATTDEDGKYRLTNVAVGTYEVAVSAPAYVVARRSLIINKPDNVENIDFALVRGGVVTGKVTDPDGRPMIETEVNLFPEVEEYSRQPAVRTDDRGIYRAFGLKAGKYRVAAGKDEMAVFGDPWSKSEYRLTYHPEAAEASGATVIEVSEGGEVTNVDVTLTRSIFRYSASGRIIDSETGKPMGGLGVGIHMFSTPRYGGSRSGGIITNRNGEFKIQNLGPGSYAVTGQPAPEADWRIEPVRFEVVDQDVTGLELKTAKGASVSGIVVMEDLRPIPELGKHMVTGSTWTQGGGRGANHFARVNPDGSFTLRGLPRGNLSLYVFGPNRLQVSRIERNGVNQEQGLEVKDLEQVTGVRVVVDYTTGVIRGTVKMKDGSMPEGARINVNWKRLGQEGLSWNSQGSPQVDSRGQFVAEHLLPGTYEVHVVLFAPSKTANANPQPIAQATQQVVVTSNNVSTVTLTLAQP